MCRRLVGFGGFDGFDGVDGMSALGALTWKSPCVPIGEADMYSCSLIYLPDSEQTFSSVRPCRDTNFASVAV